jgi:hypothetical protein
MLEVTVDNVEEAKRRQVKNGCEIIKDETDFPSCYVKLRPDLQSDALKNVRFRRADQSAG